MITLAPASPYHVGRIANRMREVDRREAAAFGRSPKNALRFGLRYSTMAFTALVDDSPEAMIGVTPTSMIDGLGCPWMLGTDEVMRHGRALVKLAPPLLDAMHGYFDRLENLVSVDNQKAIRLLGRWGFLVGGQVQNIGGVDFIPFRRER